MSKAEKTIKVCLQNRGEDIETPWAIDLGPVTKDKKGSRRVRIVNVPFLHAKPTWGDVIVVSPVDDGFPTWDRDGVAWKDIGSRIAEDGGRWAMIVDYTSHPGDTNGVTAYRALAAACETADIVCEGAWGPDAKKPGRTYLAVRHDRTAEQIISALRAAELPCELIQVHPAPMQRAPQASGVRRQASARTKKKPAKRKTKTSAKRRR